ncbi:MAG: C4-dicarboxylic acid transporter DauA [Myxococcota bacterium]|nr:C4-dicarboxylic acid transporter DauA [Myxococcota bacterium]
MAEEVSRAGGGVLSSRLPFPFAMALREAIREGYGFAQLKSDVLAGLVVGIVALPLSMALAIASGAPPQHGLYTAIVAGGIIALTGGSRTQVSGPTAAFVVILAPITGRFGLGGLMIATVMAGMMLFALGVTRMGRLIQFVPYPVTIGFTTGIGIVIATLQIKDFLGLQTGRLPDHFPQKIAALVSALPSFRMDDFVIGAVTLAILLIWPRLNKSIPAPLAALGGGAALSLALQGAWDGFSAATIQSRFSYMTDNGPVPGIPRMPPVPGFPWEHGGPNGGDLEMGLGLIQDLGPSAFAIAMLGGIESLLSATIADGMTGRKHDPDGELIGQGLGNMIAPFFGGFAATGAIARTATNIRSGAQSPIASIVHALFILGAVVVFAPWLGYLPMAALSALLIIVAWNMSEAKHFIHTVKTAPRSDVFVLVTCCLLTVVFDMVVAVAAGLLLAALLFIRRMASIVDVEMMTGREAGHSDPGGHGLLIYRVAGPLFFGAAQKAMSELENIEAEIHTVLMDLSAVPVMDATGLVNLESALARLKSRNVHVVIAGVCDQPMQVFRKAGLVESQEGVTVLEDYDEGLKIARARSV